MGGVTVTGLDPIVKQLSHAQRNLARDIRQHAVEEQGRSIAAHAKAGAARFAGSTRLVAETIRARPVAGGIEVTAGGGEGKGGEVFAGSEFGAQGRRKTTYVRRGPQYAYAVTRRTTRQFRPFVGRTGYFFWPAVRTGLRGMGERVDAALRAELGPPHA